MASSSSTQSITIRIVCDIPFKRILVYVCANGGIADPTYIERDVKSCVGAGDIYAIDANDRPILLHSHILPRADDKPFDDIVTYTLTDVKGIRDDECFIWFDTTSGELKLIEKRADDMVIKKIFTDADNLTSVPIVHITLEGTSLTILYEVNGKCSSVRTLCDVDPRTGVTIFTRTRTFALCGPEEDATTLIDSRDLDEDENVDDDTSDFEEDEDEAVEVCQELLNLRRYDAMHVTDLSHIRVGNDKIFVVGSINIAAECYLVY